MDSNNVKQLLDKYWDGLTSLEEEAQLRSYFNSGSIDPQFKADQAYFTYVKAEQTQSLSTEFDAALLEKLESSTPKPALRRQLYSVVVRVAAIGLLLFGLGWWMTNQDTQLTEPQAINWAQYEEEDPEKALEQVQQALRLISRKMQAGTNEAAAGLEKVQKATNVIK